MYPIFNIKQYWIGRPIHPSKVLGTAILQRPSHLFRPPAFIDLLFIKATKKKKKKQ